MRFDVVRSVMLILFATGAGFGAEPAGKDLLKAAKEGDAKARAIAIDTLGLEKGVIEGEIPLLIELLDDESPEIRAHAAHALGLIGPDAAEAMRPLARLVFAPNPLVRREAIKAIRKIHPNSPIALRLLGKAMESDDPQVRAHALEALTQAGEAALPLLIRALNDEKTDYWASLVIAEIGPKAAAAVPALIKVLKEDDEPEDRREAILALAAIGEASEPAVPTLIDVVKSKDAVLLGPTLYALGRIGPKAKEAQPVMEALAKASDTPPAIVATVAWAMAKINPGDKDLLVKAVGLLAQQLRSDDPKTREYAAHGLVDLKAGPEIVRPALGKAMENASDEAVDKAISAFVSLGPSAIPDLADAFEEEAQERLRLARIFKLMAERDKDAIPVLVKEALPALIDALSDKNAETRGEILLAIGALGPEAKSAVAAVGKALKDPEEDVRYAACYALGKIGPAAISVKEELVKNLDSSDRHLAMVSAWALAKIQPGCENVSPKSLPIFIKALEDENAVVRIEAVESIACLGRLAKDAVPALKKLLNDKDESVRQRAAEVLRDLQK
jgi:HEAT repeat protein